MTRTAARALLEERFGPVAALEAERRPVSPEVWRRRAVLALIPTAHEQAAHRRVLDRATRDLEDVP